MISKGSVLQVLAIFRIKAGKAQGPPFGIGPAEDSIKRIGGQCRTRTCDLLLVRQAL
jgi:hypothetical protein